jgi:hypothetical protein
LSEVYGSVVTRVSPLSTDIKPAQVVQYDMIITAITQDIMGKPQAGVYMTLGGVTKQSDSKGAVSWTIHPDGSVS